MSSAVHLCALSILCGILSLLCFFCLTEAEKKEQRAEMQDRDMREDIHIKKEGGHYGSEVQDDLLDVQRRKKNTLRVAEGRAIRLSTRIVCRLSNLTLY